MLCSHLRQFQQVALDQGIDSARNWARAYLIDPVSWEDHSTVATCRSCEATDTVNIRHKPIVKREFELKDVVLLGSLYDLSPDRGGFYQSGDLGRYGDGYLVLPTVSSKDLVCVWDNREASKAEAASSEAVNSEYITYNGPDSMDILRREAKTTGATWAVTTTGDGFDFCGDYFGALHWQWLPDTRIPGNWCPKPDRGTSRWHKLKALIGEQYAVISGRKLPEYVPSKG